ncbi:hypothetical protein KL921_001067 [Ogataea angusta]|uniref:TPR-like protein n=1 Tax=Pichia angusta TaxID=870730 RepID=A0AAN6DI97_PICAN|nr:uncharacterized protein KL928_001234 [Ogataea angusta]KAG7813521.1 hypothetical protein KL921_001067 [Ogataea angusta]KAG7821150.1 hypothetical protein KL928_001234 [Ogataea angusta]KAG7826148.1 hypothetical protein KL909_000200 [Ogataea angusta]KAG7843343.1 hypothetical protein KL942_000439 [Ogataea angusta]KAG7852504.1 hypothetical protein KL940_000205 [Ogataea angusta]
MAYVWSNEHKQPGNPGFQSPQLPAQVQEFVHTWLACGNLALEIRHANDIAARSYHNVLKYDPANINALHGLTTATLSRPLFELDFNKVHELAEILNSAFNHFVHLRTHPELQRDLANCYFVLGDLEKARSILLTTLEVSQPTASIWFTLGQTAQRMNMLPDAIESFNLCLRAASTTPELVELARKAHLELAAIANKQNKRDLAVSEFTAAVSLPPPPYDQFREYGFMWGLLALSHEKAGDLNAAVATCLKGLETVGEDSMLLLLQAHFLLQDDSSSDNLQNATSLLQRVIQIRNRESEPSFLSHYLLGRACILQDEPTKAYKSLQVSLNLAPQSALPWLTIGSLYLRLNQLTDSLNAYSQVIKNAPQNHQMANAIAWEGLGQVYEKCENQSQDAIDSYTRASECYKRCNRPEMAEKMAAFVRNLESGKHNPQSMPQDMPYWVINESLWEQVFENFETPTFTAVQLVQTSSEPPNAILSNSPHGAKSGSPRSPLQADMTPVYGRQPPPAASAQVTPMMPPHPRAFYIPQQPVHPVLSPHFRPFLRGGPVYSYPPLFTAPPPAIEAADMNYH